MMVLNPTQQKVLPFIGKSRWSDIAPFSPVSREKFRLLSLEGKAPRPERMGIRCTFFDNKEVHRWLADPLGYSTGGSN
jgi:prophage regulatory protein